MMRLPRQIPYRLAMELAVAQSIDAALAKQKELRTRAEAQQLHWPSPRRAWLAVWLLCASYALSFADRQILALLIAPIQRDLAITDGQLTFTP